MLFLINHLGLKQPEYQQKLFPHWSTVSVRFRDLDPLNHVNNAIFSTYYEEARIAFIEEIPGWQEEVAKGFGFVLANLQIDFIESVKFPSTLLIGSGIKEMGNSSITSFQAIYHKQTKDLMSVAQATGVWFDLKQQKPARVPQVNYIKKLNVKSL